MTKRRAPLSLEDKVAEVIGKVGRDELAAAVSAYLGRKVIARTVYRWSDPDSDQRLPAEAIPAIDAAWRAAGGEGSPLVETLNLLVDAHNAERFADQDALAKLFGSMIKESGEAHVAVFRAMQPGATEADRAEAVREVQEAIAPFTQSLPLLTKGTGHCGTSGGDASRGEQS